MKERVCSICGNTYELTTENFYRDSHSPGGFKMSCKTCRKVAQIRRKSKNDRRPKCLNCGERIKGGPGSSGYCVNCLNDMRRQASLQRKKAERDHHHHGLAANAWSCQSKGWAISQPGPGWKPNEVDESRLLSVCTYQSVKEGRS